MAITINGTGGNHVSWGTVTATVDTAAELPVLSSNPNPINHSYFIGDVEAYPGSLAFCIETSETYILNTQGEWLLKTSSGGGGGGSEYPSADGRKFPLPNDNLTMKTQSLYYNDIANAINTKAGSTDKYQPGEMANAILQIPGGAGYPNAEGVEF